MSKTDFDVQAEISSDRGDVSSREKLLRSAAALFSTKGFREVSVREIAANAGVNSALVGYYFRGKQALFNEAYRSHAMPLAQERARRLAAICKKGRKPSIEEVLKAWLLPWLQLESGQNKSALHLRITANLSGERWSQTTKVAPFMNRTHRAFINVLQDCLPYLSQKTLMWRLHFLVGAIAFGVRFPEALSAFSRGECNPDNLEETLAHILPYAAAGFRAHEPGKPLRLIQSEDNKQ